jgi:hypothetical protein
VIRVHKVACKKAVIGAAEDQFTLSRKEIYKKRKAALHD